MITLSRWKFCLKTSFPIDTKVGCSVLFQFKPPQKCCQTCPPIIWESACLENSCSIALLLTAYRLLCATYFIEYVSNVKSISVAYSNQWTSSLNALDIHYMNHVTLLPLRGLLEGRKSSPPPGLEGPSPMVRGALFWRCNVVVVGHLMQPAGCD